MKKILLAFLLGWTTASLFLWVMSAPAGAESVSAAVRAACTDDYLKHCSHTTPGTPECRSCFKSVGPQLSRTCLKAIRRDPTYKSDYDTAYKKKKKRKRSK